MAQTLEHAIAEALYGEGCWEPESSTGAIGPTIQAEVNAVAHRVSPLFAELEEQLNELEPLVGKLRAENERLREVVGEMFKAEREGLCWTLSLITRARALLEGTDGGS